MTNLKPLGITAVKQTRIAIEYVDIDDLIPNDYNPNIHNQTSLNLLTKSLAKFGFTQPIVARKGSNVIIDGENRLRVASILGMEQVPVVFLELNDEEMKLATIMHNQARGTHSAMGIKDISNQLQEKGIDLSKELLEDL